MREAKARGLYAWERQYSVARGAALSCGLVRVGGSGSTHRHNQALHRTARRVVVCAVFLFYSKLIVAGGQPVSLALGRRASFDASAAS